MTQLINALGFWNTTATRHTLIEDVQGIFSGSLVAALGLYVLASAGLLTGSTAGVAFLLHYAFGANFGLAFFLLNLPFFYLSWKRLGMAFTIKTFIAIGLTSVLADVQSRFLSISSIHPAWAALLGGLLLGFGLLALYRHRASLGGVGILGIYLQERFGIRAGLVQLAIDMCVLAAAFFVTTPPVVFYSVLGAVVLNLFVAINHRADRYIAL
ncbi:YitT family protein [Rhizobium leguminosarum bv. viciae 248]|uniref:YitT family protein n=1 Tax=Rhizobium leguminosarum TaxID=384 RepID=UPI0003A5380D|nr:YitT family protein [Rhizobium leguminosarum]MBY5651420.1 YitT family protein [Rhizobium leguminosarum]MBY5840805.1 YitT family protein [Rhizobium leguminosarum]MCA2412307.1 YitT family protein [Rhizobium leguminosarum]NKL81153.1 YitT family protein [Rhizobium leguminosarum bv. viciae]NKM66065.1 YitT family protein [Rhizobium leguminosarum bv. viciae]